MAKIRKKTTKKKTTKKKTSTSKKTSKKKAKKKTSSKKKIERRIGSSETDTTVVKGNDYLAYQNIKNPHGLQTGRPTEMQRMLLFNKRVIRNEKKREIALDMLERYTGHKIAEFRKQIILTNFHYYVERFNTLLDDTMYTQGSAFKASSSKKADVTIIEFGIGSAMAALVMELVAAIEPKAVLFLGLCGGVHHSLKVGDFILPIASIRAEGVSRHFLPEQVPALPTFKLQKFVSQVLVEHGYDYRTGTIHSTDLRFWEFDERFKAQLYEERVLAVEMETAALFITGFLNKCSIGALLLVSDCPLQVGGIKTKKSAKSVFRKFTDIHIELGIEIMADIAERGENIRQYRW